MKIDTDTVKKTLNVCAKFGAGTIAFSAVSNNVVTTTPVHKAMVYVATIALAGKLAQTAGSYMDEIVDDVAHMVNSSNAKIHFI